MNNFVNRSVCENFCSGAELKGAFEVAEKNSGAICFLSKVAGPCDKKVSNFYYDPNHKDCKPFLYSGCGGNDNRFTSVADCMERCSASTKSSNLASNEKSTSKATTGTQIGLGIALTILAILAIFGGIKYYKIYREKENYRIFQNELARASSVTDLNGNQFQMAAYFNPVYGGNDRDDERSGGLGPQESRQRNEGRRNPRRTASSASTTIPEETANDHLYASPDEVDQRQLSGHIDPLQGSAASGVNDLDLVLRPKPGVKINHEDYESTA